ncbi:MerR family transcriptional regulator [Arenicella chitinivorans]|uniref:MerR family transcriptional regulator n=1 Tax=Arenicella chitinivorans TaxID=1329800 RepID=A0A918VN05_9GAMM|nr:helix-turn-helix domain-containing protein [Arenicella chitinivorans]GHA14194.1 MerR family transcriptional regulator [Arenicella chitinivorans]
MIDIADVVKASGLPPSALRYYEEKGLIRSIGRNGLRRLYAQSVLQQLQFIALGKAAGFSLDEIKAMYTRDGNYSVDRRLLQTKANEIDGMIKRLEAVRDGLRHAAECPAPSHQACDKFQRLLAHATRLQQRDRTRQS